MRHAPIKCSLKGCNRCSPEAMPSVRYNMKHTIVLSQPFRLHCNVW
ncbi:MAG: hypothetical protein IJT39_05490 [Bacteroidales bacterium]|nr:hypothetical protein [Bacteroidales bacterium]